VSALSYNIFYLLNTVLIGCRRELQPCHGDANQFSHPIDIGLLWYRYRYRCIVLRLIPRETWRTSEWVIDWLIDLTDSFERLIIHAARAQRATVHVWLVNFRGSATDLSICVSLMSPRRSSGLYRRVKYDNYRLRCWTRNFQLLHALSSIAVSAHYTYVKLAAGSRFEIQLHVQFLRCI